MPWAAAAAVVSAGIGAYSSNKASKEQSKGIQKGIDASAALAQQARDDVNRLFDVGYKHGRAGIEGAFNFYRQAAPQRIAPVTQGYQQGINVLGQGAQQANNAILGLPVDMSFTNQQVPVAPIGYMDGATLTPGLVEPASTPVEEEDKAPEDPQAAKPNGDGRNLLNPLDYAGNPKALIKDIRKLEKKDPVKKLIKKLF